MDCSVLDLIFFSMIISTNHRTSIKNSKPLTQWVGTLLDNEYDLEGSVDEEIAEADAEAEVRIEVA